MPNPTTKTPQQSWSLIDRRIREARDAAELLPALAQAVWHTKHGLDRSCPADCSHPTPEALADWLLNDCPAAVRQETARRVDALAQAASDRLPHLPPGPLVDAVRLHQAWDSLPQNKRPRHPLVALLKAWQLRPRPVARNNRPDRILPSRLAMAVPSDRRMSKGLFTPAMHAAENSGRQLVLPGFERNVVGPVLPLALYDLGAGTVAEKGGRAAPLALRLWVEGVLSVRLPDRTGDHPVVMSTTLRELLKRLYPGRRKPRPNEYWPRMTAAAEALASNAARIPWEDPKTKRGGLRSVVLLSDIPRGPGALDDVVSLTVHLPPGAKDGPILPASLPLWGVRSAAAYRALIGLAFRWFEPGGNRFPISRGRRRGGGQFWLQSTKPKDYDKLTENEMISLCFPTSAKKNRRELETRARKVIEMLARKNEIRWIDGRVLPPIPDDSE